MCRLIKDTAWSWSSPQTKVGIFYIEMRGKHYFAFHNHICLHKIKKPLLTLGEAIKLCEDTYHNLMDQRRAAKCC